MEYLNIDTKVNNGSFEQFALISEAGTAFRKWHCIKIVNNAVRILNYTCNKIFLKCTQTEIFPQKYSFIVELHNVRS